MTTKVSHLVFAETLIPEELKALDAFRAHDDARETLNTVWRYDATRGYCHMACDGTSMLVRRSGDLRSRNLNDFAENITATRLDGRKFTGYGKTPPPWHVVFESAAQFRSTDGRTLAREYSWDPTLFARIALVETAMKRRLRADWAPPVSMGNKSATEARRNAVDATCVKMRVPSDPLDPLYFWADSPAALWEGLIMPRRT